MKQLSRGLTSAVTKVVIGSVVLFSCSGCAKTGSSRQGVFRIIAIDTSGSARPDLPTYRRITYKLVHELDPGRDAVRVFRFDHDCAEILSSVEQRREELLNTLDMQLRPTAKRDGTRIAKCFERIASLLDSPDARGRRVEIYALTDNGNDDRSKQMNDLYDKSAKRIASDSRVTEICYWGVKLYFREEIPPAFKKLPRSVLSVQGDTEAFTTLGSA